MRMLAKFWLERLMERDHLEELTIDGRAILNWMFKQIRWVDIDWSYLT
jgi:hypothetical protein